MITNRKYISYVFPLALLLVGSISIFAMKNSKIKMLEKYRLYKEQFNNGGYGWYNYILKEIVRDIVKNPDNAVKIVDGLGTTPNILIPSVALCITYNTIKIPANAVSIVDDPGSTFNTTVIIKWNRSSILGHVVYGTLDDQCKKNQQNSSTHLQVIKDLLAVGGNPDILSFNITTHHPDVITPQDVVNHFEKKLHSNSADDQKKMITDINKVFAQFREKNKKYHRKK